MRIKILYRKNLKMSPGKLAAQCVHLSARMKHCELMTPVAVLGVSDKKFEEAKQKHIYQSIRDAGHTEVPAGTETVMGFYE